MSAPESIEIPGGCPYVTILFDKVDGVGIESIAITESPHEYEPIAFTRFSRWGCLAFQNPCDVPVQITITVTGTNLHNRKVRRGCTTSFLTAATRPVADRHLQEIEFDSFYAGDDVQGRAARYFRDFDNETNPALFKDGGRCIRPESCAGPSFTPMRASAAPTSSDSAEREFRKSLIGWPGHGMIGLLWERLKRRHSDTGDVPENVASRARVAYLSSLQLDVLNDYYGHARRSEITDSYTRFACGELFLKTLSGHDPDNPPRISNGAPNSALAFCFAEFAFLAIEMGIDVKQWKRLLPTLVAVQEIYPLACGKFPNHRVEPIPSEDYSGCYDFLPLGKSERDAIAAKYRSLPCAALPIVSHENLRRAISTFDVAPARSR